MTLERELRLLISDWRKGRATRTLGEVLSDGYVAVLAALMFGAMLVTVLVDAQSQSAACTSESCTTARLLLPWAMLATVGAMAASVSRLFGPVVASAAEGFWLFEAPLDRRRLLLRRTLIAIGGAVVVGAVLGALVATLTGTGAAQIGGWAAACGLASGAVVAGSAIEQGLQREWVTRLAVWLLGALALAGFLMVVAVASGWATMPLSSQEELQLAWIVAAASGAVLALSSLVAVGRLNNIRRSHLVAGGELVSGMAGAAFAMDFGLIRDMIIERRELERGQVRPTRGQRTGLDALEGRDWQRLQRRPQLLVGPIAVLVVPYAMNALGFGAFAPTVSALALFVTLVPLMNGMRVLSRTKGLARCFPFDTPALRKASMRVPAVVAGMWSVAAIPAMVVNRPLFEAVVVALLIGAAGVIAATRWVTCRPVDYGTPQMYTPMGALPPGLAMNLVAGIEVVVLITAPLVFNLPWMVSAAIAAIAFLLVQGHITMDRLQEQQEEQQRLLAEAKQKRGR